MAPTPDPFKLPWVRYGPVVDLHCPASGVVVDVRHGLGETPTGYLVVLQTGPIAAVQVEQWGKEFAYVQAATDHTRARIIFLVLRDAAERQG